MQLKVLSLAAVGAVAFVATALAHHSFAMFDAEKTVTLNGTVKEFEWSNPHSWIRIDVLDQTGKELQWAIEMNAPAQLTQRGWNPTTIKPGDKITLTMHPLKDGARGGQFMTATLADGKSLSNGPNNPAGRNN